MRILNFLTAAVCVTLIGTEGVAQNSATRTERVQDGDANRAGSLDSRTMGATIRASQFMGQNIQNSQGESVGKVSDVVLDASRGKISYVAVTYGGFLGIGNDMHAVPFEAFKFMPDPDDRDETVLVLNVTKQQMEGAKGFNESTWPNFADKAFRDSVDKRYGVDRLRMREDRMDNDRMNDRTKDQNTGGDDDQDSDGSNDQG